MCDWLRIVYTARLFEHCCNNGDCLPAKYKAIKGGLDPQFYQLSFRCWIFFFVSVHAPCFCCCCCCHSSVVSFFLFHIQFAPNPGHIQINCFYRTASSPVFSKCTHFIDKSRWKDLKTKNIKWDSIVFELRNIPSLEQRTKRNLKKGRSHEWRQRRTNVIPLTISFCQLQKK